MMQRNLVYEFRDVVYCRKTSDDWAIKDTKRLTVVMQEDINTVLRGMLTQFGEGDNLIGHGEGDEGTTFRG